MGGSLPSVFSARSKRAWALCFLGLACGEGSETSRATALSGVVVDAVSGEPIAGVRVASNPETAVDRTGDDGRFLLEGAAFNVLYRLSFERDGYAFRTFDVTPRLEQNPELRIPLDPFQICDPGERRCSTGGAPAVELCVGDASTFEVVQACDGGQLCFMGECLDTRSLSVSVQGGLVLSEPTGIVCNPTCEAVFAAGQEVSLTAQPFAGASFTGWSGDCSGMVPTCTLTMDANRTVEAIFNQNAFSLSVELRGAGEGRVTSEPAGVDCAQDCDRVFDRDTMVTLTAAPEGNSEFAGWQGDCSGNSPTCTLVMDSDRRARARFVVPQRELVVQLEGPGAGSVESVPAGIACPPDCAAEFELDAAVTLMAMAAPANDFDGWSGDCSGTGDCTVQMDGNRQVGARFEGVSFDLTVATVGDGMGRVLSTPAGIDCGVTCVAAFGQGTMVELQATPEAGSRFEGWEGDCAGTGSCMVLLDGPRAVQARYTLEEASVTVSIGTGAGRVRSDPPGIDCPGTCFFDFPLMNDVQLQAIPEMGQALASWGGDCQGTSGDGCVLTIDGAKAVQVDFDDFFRLPLAADMGCTSLLRFEPPDRELNTCATGTTALAQGSWSSVASRNPALSDAYAPDDATSILDTQVRLNPPRATVEMTVRRTGDRPGDDYAVLISTLDAGDPEPFGLELRAYMDGSLEALTRTRTTTTSVRTSSAALPLSTWRHVAASVEPNRLSLWVDGVEQAGVSTSVQWTGSATAAVVAGRRRDGQVEHVLDGDVDEVRLSDVSRY